LNLKSVNYWGLGAKLIGADWPLGNRGAGIRLNAHIFFLAIARRYNKCRDYYRGGQEFGKIVFALCAAWRCASLILLLRIQFSGLHIIFVRAIPRNILLHD
jgi:hypothetical protein